MFRTIVDKIKADPDYPERSRAVDIYTRVVEGALYEHLPHGFHTERLERTDEYIPLRERRPSVRTGLCRVVVDDSVSLLFSEGHFPAVDCDDETTKEGVAALVKDMRLNETMLTAATWGSVGSVALFLRVLRQKDGSNRAFIEPKRTRFLTPTFDPNDPTRLLKIAEQYKVTGEAVRAMGYAVKDDDIKVQFWFAREWNDQEEVWFKPWPVKAETEAERAVSQYPRPFTKDDEKTVKHALGFVPWVWVKNLPGELKLLADASGDLSFSDVDGACTFEAAVDTMIEVDYLLSQAGRGLKYNMDPLLLVKEPVDDTPITKDGSIVKVDAQGDGKMIEIEGTAFTVVMEFCKELRQLALEAVHGNRSDPDKLSSAQSGRAMELMNQALIWLADRLRVTYGEGALLSLLRMLVQAHQKYPLVLSDGEKLALSGKQKLTLRWPRWYAPTEQDRQNRATTLATHKDAGHISQETAVKTIAADYDVEDPAKEVAAIRADQEREIDLLARQTEAKSSVTTSV